MALTGKTISELDLLQFPTNDTAIPVEYVGDTYHITFSSITYNEGTYSQFVTEAGSGVLTPGRWYLMTDFQTCYDQPNYDSVGDPITTGNYKTGTTEPILLLAISTTGFSPTVYSTLYPQDKISYDISWNTTEVTSSPAKGRITERIDQLNNRADYDFRAVQFIRYVGWFSEDYREGKINLDASTGLVTGFTTTFQSQFNPTDILGVYYPDSDTPIACFRYYEITSIISDTEMYVTGRTLSSITNTYYSTAQILPNYMSPFQNNVTGGTNDDSAEYYTFNDGENVNTYLGNNLEYNTFILSNNVFLSGTYLNNTFGGNVVGNTFNDDMDSNTCGAEFQYNIITNDFDQNTVGPNFKYNIIDCDMDSNQIGEGFSYNMLGDGDSYDFNYNVIQTGFENNFITFDNDDFFNNIIGFRFQNNIIDSGFQNNKITGDFNGNLIIENDFDDNEIGEGFINNLIYDNFNSNKLGNSFYNNIIYTNFSENTFGENVNTNTFGDPNNIGSFSFLANNIGGDFTGNYFSGDTQYNTIGHGCGSNNVDTNFSYNQIGTNFGSNTIANDFGFGGGNYRGNIVGNGFVNNTVGEYCYDNTFGDNCADNNLGDYFVNNKVSYGFNSVTTNDLDTSSNFQNNNFTYGYFNGDLTLTGGTGGNPIFYSQITTNVVRDAADNNGYVTFLSGGTIVAETITI
jgi:hypothetical protein